MEILTSILEEHEDLYVSLACTNRLLAHGAPAVVEEVAQKFEELKKRDPAELGGLIDLLPANPFVALLRAKPPEAFAKVERQISIAVLVTAHAFFESVIKELVQLAMLCDRQKWVAELQGKTVTIGEVQAKGLQTCVDDVLAKELNRLAMAGMPTLLGRLLGCCKGNVTTKSVLQNYSLDLDRLKVIDQRRHDYAHRRTKVPYSIVDADKDLRYLAITAVHLVVCIMDAYGLKGQHRTTLQSRGG